MRHAAELSTQLTSPQQKQAARTRVAQPRPLHTLLLGEYLVGLVDRAEEAHGDELGLSVHAAAPAHGQDKA